MKTAAGQNRSFDMYQAYSAAPSVYAAAERGPLPGDAWQLLDPRLQRSFWWPNWDKCIRIRHTVVGMYVDREIDAASFLKITDRDDVFAELIDVVADSYRMDVQMGARGC
jgi:hypothetical protein